MRKFYNGLFIFRIYFYLTLLFYININFKRFVRIGSQLNVYIARMYYKKCHKKSFGFSTKLLLLRMTLPWELFLP